MNRNTMFEVFKNAGLVKSIHKHNNGIYTMFEKPSEWQDMYFSTDKFLIRGVSSIILCSNELVILSSFETMKVNIKYININTIVIGAEEYE